jgi:hypothetical protein
MTNGFACSHAKKPQIVVNKLTKIFPFLICNFAKIHLAS